MNEEYFEILLERYLCGELDAEAMEEFERLLLSDRRMRGRFWRGVKLDSALRRRGGEAWGRKIAVQDPGLGRRWGGWKRRGALAAVAAVAALLLGLVVPAWLAVSERRAELVPPVSGEAGLVVPGVAVLREVRGHAVVEGREVRGGEELRAAETLHLRSGTLHASLYSGSQLVMEGGARLVFHGESSVELVAGMLRLEVPAVTGRLTLMLPGARLEAGVSRFASWVGADGTAAVRVQDGELEAWPADGADSVRLGPGDHTLDIEGGIRSGLDPALGSALPFAGPAAVPLAERRRQEFAEWQRASDSRAGDESLLLYLRFQSGREPESGFLVNEGGHEDGSADAVLVSGNWVEGRWPGKRALLLQSAADRARFRVDGRHPRVSFCAWVQPWRFDHSLNALLMSQWGIDGEVHWQFSADGGLRFGVRPSGGNDDGLFHRVFADSVLTPEMQGSWCHLVTTYDADARVVIHYLNGRELKRGVLSERVLLAFGHATIGNATNPPPDVWGPRPFGGALDEIAIYARVLGPEEVRRLHREGRPGDAAGRD